MSTTTISGRALLPRCPISQAATYELDIKRATDAKTLHQMRATIIANPQLWPEEKSELCETIARRFGQLNLSAAGDLKARWGETGLVSAAEPPSSPN